MRSFTEHAHRGWLNLLRFVFIGVPASALRKKYIDGFDMVVSTVRYTSPRERLYFIDRTIHANIIIVCQIKYFLTETAFV